MPNQLPRRAAELLAELQHGERFAELNVYPGSLAFNDYALAYLNNAAALCRTGTMDDHRIFGALYCLRHGIELWLKCLDQNAILDRALEEIALPDSTFESVAIACGQISKSEKKVFQCALCAVRNVIEDKVFAPQCWEQNISREHAERAITLIRSIGTEPRSQVSTAWAVPVSGHRIQPVWNRVRSWVTEMWRGAAAQAHHIGFPEPLKPDRVEAICELVGALDDAGIAFRYPTTLDGQWHLGLPHMNLDALAELIDELESTIDVYNSLLRDAYCFSTLRSPRPSYPDY